VIESIVGLPKGVANAPLKPQQLITATAVALAIGGGGTLAAMTYASDDVSPVFAGWLLVPYLILLIDLARARTQGMLIVTFAVSILAVVFAIAAYFDALFISTSSTSALAFLFVPLYQLVAALVVLVVSFYFGKPPA
jgi:hypothetical protein